MTNGVLSLLGVLVPDDPFQWKILLVPNPDHEFRVGFGTLGLLIMNNR